MSGPAKKRVWMEIGYGIEGDHAALARGKVCGTCAHGHPMFLIPGFSDRAVDLGCDAELELRDAHAGVVS